MEKTSIAVEALTRRIQAKASYEAYLRMLGRCGVINVPKHGWVA